MESHRLLPNKLLPPILPPHPPMCQYATKIWLDIGFQKHFEEDTKKQTETPIADILGYWAGF